MPRPKSKRRIFDLRINRSGVYELAERGGKVRLIPVRSQKLAIKIAADRVRALEPSQLIIRRRDGRIAKKGERTYPRSSDPKRHKG